MAINSLISNKREWNNHFIKFSINFEMFYIQNDKMLSKFLQNDEGNQFPYKVITVYELITKI